MTEDREGEAILGPRQTYWVQADDNLPHQIRLVFGHRVEDGRRSATMEVAVSCTCLKMSHGPNHYKPMGFPGAKSPWPIYNDPANHVNLPVPFTYDMQGGANMFKYREGDKWSTQP
jgi:hypothetical protein